MRDPDISFGGLSVWIHRRANPEATDYWDANWLIIQTTMQVGYSSVSASGAIIMTSDFVRFRQQLVEMYKAVAGQALLSSLEPNLTVFLLGDQLGHILGKVEITPDHLQEYHRFDIQLDQSYLPQLIAACDAIIERFPVIGQPDI